MGNPRRSYKRDQLILRMRSMELPCHICGRPIDYSLPAGDPWSFEADEDPPISRFPPEQRKTAACDPNIVKPSHRICNQRKGARCAGDLGAASLPIRRTRRW